MWQSSQSLFLQIETIFLYSYRSHSAVNKAVSLKETSIEKQLSQFLSELFSSQVALLPFIL